MSSSIPIGGATTAPSTTEPTVAPSSAPAGYARAAFSITVPKASVSADRVRQTIGSGTQSITFTLLQSAGTSTSGTPQTFALTATAPGCATNANGLTCTLSVSAPLGLDVFLAQTFTNTNGTGSLTGSGAVQLDVATNSSNTASLSLTSQAQSVYLAASSTYLGAPYQQSYSLRREAAARRGTESSSTVTSMRVFVIALDSAGNAILNPSIYDTPISLQIVFEDIYGNPVAQAISDVTLAVAYSASVDPGGCSGNGSTSASYGSVQVCSPADVVTATFNNVANGAPGAAIIGSIGATGYFPAPAPSTTPAPFPTSTPANASFFEFPVTVSASATAAPSTGSVPVVGQ